MMRIAIYPLILLFGVHITSWAMDVHKQEQPLPLLTEAMTTDKWLNFARIGGGYYPIPEQFKQYLPKMLELARSVPTWNGKSSYYCDDRHQIEFLHAEQSEWANYPEEVQAIALGMRDIAIHILVNLLQALEIDKNLYSQVTGGLSDTNGKHFLKVAHYDAAKLYPGLPWHKDIRWVSVLFINQEGLEAEIGDKIIPVHPLEGYFFINLGVFFEAFINDSEKLKALVHQVTQVDNDRVSFGVFVEGNYPAQGFYQQFNDAIVWKSVDEMKPFLVADKQQSFSSGPHRIFSSFDEEHIKTVSQ